MRGLTLIRCLQGLPEVLASRPGHSCPALEDNSNQWAPLRIPSRRMADKELWELLLKEL